MGDCTHRTPLLSRAYIYDIVRQGNGFICTSCGCQFHGFETREDIIKHLEQGGKNIIAIKDLGSDEYRFSNYKDRAAELS